MQAKVTAHSLAALELVKLLANFVAKNVAFAVIFSGVGLRIVS